MKGAQTRKMLLCFFCGWLMSCVTYVSSTSGVGEVVGVKGSDAESVLLKTLVFV